VNSGQEIKAQVATALEIPHPYLNEQIEEARAAFTPCIVLTAEEAGYISRVLNVTRGMRQGRVNALALLTPDEAEADDE